MWKRSKFLSTSQPVWLLLIETMTSTIITRMWANAQRDGHPAKHRWRPLFDAAKFGWRPLLDVVQ